MSGIIGGVGSRSGVIGRSKDTPKAWCQIDGTTNTIHTEFNIDSMSDIGTGNYSFELDVTMRSTEYAITTGLGGGRICLASPTSTTAVSVQVLDTSSANIDSNNMSIAVWE